MWVGKLQRLLNTKMKKAGVDANIESYSWDTTTVYDCSLARKLFSLAFIEAHSSVLIFGPTGAGKTFLAKHLAFACLKAGYSVTFARADKLFKHLRLSAIDGMYIANEKYPTFHSKSTPLYVKKLININPLFPPFLLNLYK